MTRSTSNFVISRRRRGLTAMMAMIFLAMASTLALGMYAASTTTTASARNMIEGDRARGAAESGLRWISWRFTKMTRPRTTAGNITPAVATTLWPQIRTSVTTDLTTMLQPAERGIIWDGTTLSSRPIAVDATVAGSPAPQFVVSIRPHPLFAGDPLDARYLNVRSTGLYRGASRVLSMDFLIDKRIRFAMVGKVPIQLGRNTMVEGPVAVTVNKYPPIYSLSDFRHLDQALASRIDSFNGFLKAIHRGYDNRISVNDGDEFPLAVQAGYADSNGDSYIDEYDLFLAHFDRNKDQAISASEFTNPSTGKMYDPDLFATIDALGPPLTAAEALRSGYRDSVIDNRDSYAKVRGQISLATTNGDWSNNLKPQNLAIQDMIKGPIAPDSGELPLRFGVPPSEILDLSPTNFDTSSFKKRTGTDAGATRTAAGPKVTIENKTLSTVDSQIMRVTTKGSTPYNVGDFVLKSDFDATNATLTAAQRAAGTNSSAANAVEKVPFGSTAHQATYQRPVFRNMNFKNVRIPKGLNALFDNCTFEGVTYVELQTNITTSGGSTTTSPGDGMAWSQRMKTGSFNADTALTAANSQGFNEGNNLRFNNCNIKGPVASDNPTAYTHFTNSMEFTGATMFDNQADQTATIVAPQTNIEMGSFTDPSKAPSTLVGVVVAGNIDIRGSSKVDGSIIVTGDGAGSTTMGWFGPSDAATEPTSAMPEGGWGRLSIVYNPNRPLPDGINLAIDIVPNIDSYTEGH
ncbi:MAG: hypothetical protein QOF78_2281 [Phycisphaerales bacterium]|jgi:hypothetical protein|nr:hypothetical protein [Phycisphaerales bacterium]